LRERRSDIPELIEHFLTSRPIGPLRSRVDAEVMKALRAYSWPGNVRELANALERAQILAENHLITPEDLPENILVSAAAPEQSGDPRHLREMERRHVQSVLQEEKGNKVQAARVLGISRHSLYRLIEKYHLE
jgi:DNA-binding NtrC family response regulator